MADSSLMFDILARDRTQAAFNSSGDGADRLGGKMKGLGKAAAIALGAATIAAGAFAIKIGKDSVDAASDLNETVSKARTIFGPAAADLESWASRSAKAFGQSKQGALDAAGTFGNLFVQLGIGTGKAAGMSKQMVELASDFASFHNADPTDVIEAQTAAFRGEYDALQRYVPTINAAAVQQEALAMTHKKTTKELTDQDKALATQALMMKGAGDAAGDFGRTSDGLANKQRIFGAQIEDLKAKIGNGLLPVVSAVTGFLSDKFLPAVEAAGRFASIAGAAFKSAFSGEGVTSDGVIGFFERLGVAAMQVRDQIVLFVNALRTGFTEDEGTPIERLALTIRETLLPILERVVAFVQANMTPILIGLGAVLVGLLSPFLLVAGGLAALYLRFEGFRDGVATVAAAVSQFWNDHARQFQDTLRRIGDAASSFFGALGALFKFVTAIITDLWDRFGHTLLDKLRIAFDAIFDIARGALAILGGIFDLIKAVLTGKWGEAWEALKQIAWGAWETIKGYLRLGLDAVALLFEGAKAAISAVWAATWHGLSTIVSDVLTNIKRGIGNAVEWIRKQIDSMLGPLDEVIGKLGKIGGGVLGGALGHIPGFAGGVTDFRGGLAYVHQGEVLANLPKGTDVIPRGQVEALVGARSGGTVINQNLTVVHRERVSAKDEFRRMSLLRPNVRTA